MGVGVFCVIAAGFVIEDGSNKGDSQHKNYDADNTGIDTYGIRHINQDEHIDECIRQIGGNVTGAIAEYIIPL